MQKSLIETLFTPQEQQELKQSMKQVIITQFEKDLNDSSKYLICGDDIQEWIAECLEEMKDEIKSEFKEKMRVEFEKKFKEVM
jgi:DNA-binding ferritin-like protein (Dps family)